jgi:hypothetical protein
MLACSEHPHFVLFFVEGLGFEDDAEHVAAAPRRAQGRDRRDGSVQGLELANLASAVAGVDQQLVGSVDHGPVPAMVRQESSWSRRFKSRSSAAPFIASRRSTICCTDSGQSAATLCGRPVAYSIT